MLVSLRGRQARRSGEVAFGRFEHEDRLYRGIKDRHAYVVVRRGGSEIWSRGRTYRVGPGDVVLKHPGEVYRDLRREGPSDFDVVLLDARPVDDASRAAGVGEVAFAAPVLAAGDPRARPLLALHAALCGGPAAPAQDHAIDEASAALVAIAAPESDRSSRVRERPAVVRARRYLRERLGEAVSLDELADHVRLDKYHLIRAFRAEIGLPPYEYLTHLRMARACELLRRGRAAADVAAALGYCDQSQMHRHFVRIVGVTPGAYARARR